MSQLNNASLVCDLLFRIHIKIYVIIFFFKIGAIQRF